MFVHYPPGIRFNPSAETIAYFEYSAYLFTRPQQVQVNELINGLIADGLWSKIYQLQIYAGPGDATGNYPDATMPLRNLKRSTWGPDNTIADFTDASMYSEHSLGYHPTFTPWRGFNLNSTERRFIRPSRFPMFGSTIVSGDFVADIPDLINDFSFGVWSLTDSQIDGGDLGVTDWGEDYDSGTDTYSHNTEAGWGLKLRDTSGNLKWRVNSDSWRSITNSSSKGFFTASRTNELLFGFIPNPMANVFRNGLLIDVVSGVPAPLSGTSTSMGQNLHQMAGQNDLYPCDRFWVGMTNERPNGTYRVDAPGVAMFPNRSNREYAAHFFGKGLTETDQTNLFNRLKTYLLNHLSASDLGV